MYKLSVLYYQAQTLHYQQSHVSHSYSVELYHIPYAIETLDSSVDVVHIAVKYTTCNIDYIRKYDYDDIH